jgi:SulP family sulfate permease
MTQGPYLNKGADILTPKFVTALQEGYSWRAFANDVMAGLTVAIVALPLAMAIAIASGTSPERGLYTSIIAGFIISALGGSRYQVGGPTAAFIVVVYATIQRHGLDGLLIATFIAGLLLILTGLLRLGTYVKYIPYPVVTGFTAGIAVSIFMTQVRDLLGLQVSHLPADFIPKVEVLWGALGTFSAPTVTVSAATLATVLIVRRVNPILPAFLIAVVIGAAVAWFMPGHGIATIGSEFNGVPSTLPSPALPDFSIQKTVAVLPDAFTIALLAGIESLLSAVIADGMTGRRHRSNMELIAQGVANLGSVLFGGISATGAIARTATNIRSGARTPAAGMLHAAFLLLFMLVAAPLLSYLPLAALGAVLAVVAWNMSDHHQFLALLRSSWSDRFALLITFFLTVFVDLTVALQAGVIFAAFAFMHRMAEATSVEIHDANGTLPHTGIEIDDDQIAVLRLDGPFFFGTASRVADAIEIAGTEPRAFVLDFSAVPFVDSTAANALRAFLKKARSDNISVYAANLRAPARAAFERSGLGPPHIHFSPDLKGAIAAARVMPSTAKGRSRTGSDKGQSSAKAARGSARKPARAKGRSRKAR